MRTTGLVLCLAAVPLGVLALWLGSGNRITPTEISAVSPVATFTAAGVALWIATTDRRKQIRDREAEAAAQAKLVNVTAEWQDGPRQLRASVTNQGPKGIVDLTFVGIAIDGHDSLAQLQPTTGPNGSIVEPAAGNPMVAGVNRSLILFEADEFPPDHPFRVAMWARPTGEPPTISNRTRVTVTVRWTDASGKTWERSGTGPFRTGNNAFTTELGQPSLVSR